MIGVGKPVVLVVVGGGAISIDFAKGHPSVAVVREALFQCRDILPLVDLLTASVLSSAI